MIEDHQLGLPHVTRSQLRERVLDAAAKTRKEAGLTPRKKQKKRKVVDDDDGDAEHTGPRRIQHLSERTLQRIVAKAFKQNRSVVTTQSRYNATRDMKNVITHVGGTTAAANLPSDGEGIDPSMQLNGDVSKVCLKPDGQLHVEKFSELFPTFETLKTHVNMDGEGSSRRAAMYRNVSIRIPLRPQIAVSEFI
jgi:hypothetical protein